MSPPALTQALLVAGGGALGAVCRWGLTAALRPLHEFPFATLSVNALGCLLAGVLLGGFGLDRERLSDEPPLALMVGFLGALTTFSTFSTDTLILFRRGGAVGPALLNVALNVVLSLGAVVLGARLGEAWLGGRTG